MEYYSRDTKSTGFYVNIGSDWTITLRFDRDGNSEDLWKVASYNPFSGLYGKHPMDHLTLIAEGESKVVALEDLIQTGSEFIVLRKSTGRLYGESSPRLSSF